MAKTVRERKLDSPAARAKLKHSGKPYWRAIDTGLHLGYRKGLNGGKWVLRRYLGKETYHVETIGIADDHSAADGVRSSTSSKRSGRLARSQRLPRRQATRGPFTVAAALDAYFERLEHEGSKSLVDARGRARLHILPRAWRCAGRRPDARHDFQMAYRAWQGRPRTAMTAMRYVSTGRAQIAS